MIIGPAFGKRTNKLHHQGKHEKDFLFYLNQGFRVGVSAGQDNHKRTWGKATHARLGVWAEQLTTEGIFDALRSRRCYASEDETLRLWFTVNETPMGGEAVLSDTEPARLLVSWSDPEESQAKYRVKVFYDDAPGGDVAKVIENERFEGNQEEIVFTHSPEIGGYYFVKITQQSDHNDDAWTSPVWIGPTELDQDDPEKEEITWDEADDYVGEEKTVTGKIVRTHNHANRIVFFNFDPDYENTLSLVLRREHFDRFGGATEIQARLMGKIVTVRGEISLFRDRIQMLLEDPEQIVVVE